MNMIPVNSSLIQAIGFENGEMRLEFQGGKTYSYTGPRVQEHYTALMSAPSTGKHFLTHVKRCPQTVCTAVAPEAVSHKPVVQCTCGDTIACYGAYHLEGCPLYKSAT